MAQEIRSKYYRISIKGLILDETRSKFLIIQEENGLWELPGGGWEWGEAYDECLKRELQEEMGLTVTRIKKTPSYLIPGHMNIKKEFWITNVVFEVTVQDLNFTPSNECVAVKFVTPEEVREMETFENVQLFAELFDPKNHIQ